MTDEELRQLDIRYLWHPCTDIDALEQMPFPIIERAKGVYLYEIMDAPCLTVLLRGGVSTSDMAIPAY